MITDPECNTVYFSEKLAAFHPEEFKIITNVLGAFDYINVKLLKGTLEIWARDYMPIQLADKMLIHFRYNPSYESKDKWISPTPLLKPNGLKAKSSFYNINLDGGNVVKWKDKVIITDRVVKENPRYEKEPLLLYDRIAEELQTEVIIIPAHEYKDDLTGHADGMMRFVDGSTLIGNNLKKEILAISNPIKRILSEHGLSYIDMPFFEDKSGIHSAIGIYVNYLEVADIILFPIFKVGGKTNEEALNIMENTFPDRKIIPINIDPIARDGGLMNCISWCVKE